MTTLRRNTILSEVKFGHIVAAELDYVPLKSLSALEDLTLKI